MGCQSNPYSLFQVFRIRLLFWKLLKCFCCVFFLKKPQTTKTPQNAKRKTKHKPKKNLPRHPTTKVYWEVRGMFALASVFFSTFNTGVSLAIVLEGILCSWCTLEHWGNSRRSEKCWCISIKRRWSGWTWQLVMCCADTPELPCVFD